MEAWGLGNMGADKLRKYGAGGFRALVGDCRTRELGHGIIGEVGTLRIGDVDNLISGACGEVQHKRVGYIDTVDNCGQLRKG